MDEFNNILVQIHFWCVGGAGGGISPAETEAVIVNGVTAWQMLHRRARVRAGQTVLVHGASGGVGTLLVQLAGPVGAWVIGTASPRQHGALRALGAEPLDDHALDLAAQVRRLAPGGVDAVSDHLGLGSARQPFSLLARHGTLVAYGTVADQWGDTSVMTLFARMLGQLAAWNLRPGGPRASFLRPAFH